MFEFLTVIGLLVSISHCKVFNQRYAESFCVARNKITVWHGFDFILPKLGIVQRRSLWDLGILKVQACYTYGINEVLYKEETNF